MVKMFTASKLYFYQNSKYQNSDRIHCKCVLHIKNIAKILDTLAIIHVQQNALHMKRCQKNRDIIFLYTIQFIVYILKFKFITIMVVSDLVCHGMVVPGKAVYTNDSAKITPDQRWKNSSSKPYCNCLITKIIPHVLFVQHTMK